MKYNYEIKDLSVTHNAIADWLIANPGKGQQGRCAAHFGITESWLSTLVNQDAFKALLQSKQDKVFDEVVIPLQDKIAGVAHAAVNKLGEVVDQTNDGRLIKDVADSMLDKLGYGAKYVRAPGTVINNNTLVVDQAALAEARARQSHHFGRTLESPSRTADTESQAGTPQLPPGEEPGVGAPRDLRSEHVNGEAPFYREPEEGGDL